jgi:capsular polysaccharide biosynthesis protein
VSLASTVRRCLNLIPAAHPEICSDVSKWARIKGITVRELNPPIYDETAAAIKDAELRERKLASHRDVLRRPQTLVAIPGAVVRGRAGVVQLPDGRMLLEGNWTEKHLRQQSAYSCRWPGKKQKLAGNVCSLLCLWCELYYHWFIDVLPRLESALTHLPHDTVFLMNDQPAAWQLDSLKAFGIGEERIKLQQNGMHTEIEMLWFATPVCQTGYASRLLVERVSVRLRNYFNARDSCRRRKVYVSRSRSRCRRLTNEKDLVGLLKSTGFDIVLCEDMSLKEQVLLFSEARMLAGVHGGGLTNVIFLREGTTLKEINFCDNVDRGHYWFLANILGVDYRLVPAEKTLTRGQEYDLFLQEAAINQLVE